MRSWITQRPSTEATKLDGSTAAKKLDGSTEATKLDELSK
jgi:hypothetical protein